MIVVTLLVLVSAGVIASGIVWQGKVRRRAQASSSEETPRFPPDYDLNNPGHVALIDVVRDKYSYLLGYDTGPYSKLVYKPSSMLPFPKDEIRKAMLALLRYANGSEDSELIPETFRSARAIDAIQSSLLVLDHYLDLPADRIPLDPVGNAIVGQGLEVPNILKDPEFRKRLGG